MSEIIAKLAASADWHGLTAYEMTKRYCAELTSAGEKIPSWTVIRSMIGKGSANDINRAKDDFRKEHGSDLRKMAGYVDGLPDTLAPHIQAFWQEAVAFVKRDFSDQELQWQRLIEESSSRAEQFESELKESKSHSRSLSLQLQAANDSLAALNEQLRIAEGSRISAEQVSVSLRQEIKTQHDSMMTALANAQDQVTSAVSRLEGVENHALLQVQEARDDAATRVRLAETKLKETQADHAVELNRLRRGLSEARNNLSEQTAVAQTAQAENLAIKQHAEYLERLVMKSSAIDPSSKSTSLRARVGAKLAESKGRHKRGR